MKKSLIIVLLCTALVAKYANSQDVKLYFQVNYHDAETYYYFGDDSVYVFDFLSASFCDMGSSFVGPCTTKGDTVLVEGLGDFIFKKTN